MKKIDFKKEMKQLYSAPSDTLVEITVPPTHYLMIDGKGDPNKSQQYRDAVEALFSVAYALKFAVKKREGIDYGVMPLEGLWWTEAGKEFQLMNKDDWFWTALILQPEFVTEQLFGQTVHEVEKKKKLPALPLLRLARYSEGKVVQVMHNGPYSEEGPTIARLHSYAHEHGYTLAGKHHEIYLNTPDRTAPEKLRTILRQPVR